ncbi:hypothetical protein CH298_23000 [Rhodococcoides fascians]|uniref:hypothetical protein n=1 Tax=Rhodococcoides fascians TaxID=1828 RepID=UPI000B9BAF44|nr:hypothetical protein [Rhodococcus fascians]OZE85518.1 hypothetical protein CH303_23355 [Rhodococcus fascians]OZF12025.1 hypothetical protein CH298_23000 [Rhodococcus fascians]OZF14793.1 hypothetical protein CH297_23380 [Rhodococcus fascians]OZF61372.1 hypothetical protein CH308_23000 [Rhodococcus fascians]OZF64477.1 hypothetical protein CH307_23195 [Rhodococcus fascians]
MAGRIASKSTAGRVGVPPELAAGPSVPVWADAESLAQLAMITEVHPDWGARRADAMLSARAAWSRGLSRWAADVGLDNVTARSMVVQCRPFWP